MIYGGFAGKWTCWFDERSGSSAASSSVVDTLLKVDVEGLRLRVLGVRV